MTLIHIIYGRGKCNSHIMTLIHIVYGKGKCNICMTIKDAHYMLVVKCNIIIMTLNPHYLWEAKMLNPYIKHGTILVEFDDRIKTIQGD
jgi:hypothetical protein